MKVREIPVVKYKLLLGDINILSKVFAIDGSNWSLPNGGPLAREQGTVPQSPQKQLVNVALSIGAMPILIGAGKVSGSMFASCGSALHLE